MADYSQDAIEFYNDAKEDGGPITVIFPKIKAIVDVTNNRPWKGSDTASATCDTFALFAPSTNLAKRFCYIPGYKLTANNIKVRISKGDIIRDQRGYDYEVVDDPEITISGGDTILFICEVQKWPV